MRLLGEAISEVREVLKGYESNVGTACETAQILNAMIEKMFPQEDTVCVETG